MWQYLQEMTLKNYKMKQFESRSLPTEEVKYSVVFPETPQVHYSPKSGKTFLLVCTVKKIKHA